MSLFEVHTTVDRHVLKETYWKTMDIKDILWFTFWTAALIALFAYNAETVWKQDRILVYSILAAYIILHYLVIMPTIWIKRTTQKSLKAYGKEETHRAAVFYEDHFLWYHIEANTEKTYHYDAIVSIKETKGYFILPIRGVKAAFIVAKGGFTKGTPEEFYTFIRDKLGK